MLLKSFWTNHMQMINKLEPLFLIWTDRQKGEDVDETKLCMVPSKNAIEFLKRLWMFKLHVLTFFSKCISKIQQYKANKNDP